MFKYKALVQALLRGGEFRKVDLDYNIESKKPLINDRAYNNKDHDFSGEKQF